MDGLPDITNPTIHALDLALSTGPARDLGFGHPLQIAVREARLLAAAPWVRSLGKLPMEVKTEGWRFPAPPKEAAAVKPRLFTVREEGSERERASRDRRVTPLKPPADAVMFKDRLLYLLQPPLESFFTGKQVTLPSPPYPYQMEGIAFLVPRHAALLADEMGLGKTMQAILSLRLLFQTGQVSRVLIVCPKPLVNNWARELRTWAADLPFEIVGGDGDSRRASWIVSNCPVKLVNYELLTRDAGMIADERVRFDVVVLDEAQRIKNRDAKTAQAVRSIRRAR